MAYLSNQVALASATGSEKLLLQHNLSPIPDPYLTVCKLRLYSGKNGTVPFLDDGNYLEQPYLYSEEMEACIIGEIEFARLQKALKPK